MIRREAGHFTFKPRSQSAYWYFAAGALQLWVLGTRLSGRVPEEAMFIWAKLGASLDSIFLAAVFLILGYRTWRNTWVEIDSTQFRITRPNIVKLNELVIPFAALRGLERVGPKKLLISYDNGSFVDKVRVAASSEDLDKCDALLSPHVQVPTTG